MSVAIRSFEIKDAQAVSSLIRRNFLEINSKDYPLTAMQELAHIYSPEKIISIASYAHSYVAVMGDTILGCGSIASYWGKEDESILLTIFVLPEYHGRGVGKQIVSRLEQDAFFTRARRIEIPSSITACGFYRKLGYHYKDGIKALDDEGHYRLEKFNSTH